MSTCSTAQLTLPRWDVGALKIRFIYLANLTSFRLTECPKKSPLIPLYLGADLFSTTDIRIENHPRYHAKFAKKGYATKLHFSTAFRFDGLRVPTSTNSLWFYSIQGLFRVAFELYNKQEQLDVMENLQDVWKSQMNDSPLEITYDISVQLDSVKVITLVDATPTNATSFGDNSVDTSVDHNYCSPIKESFQTQLESVQTTLSSLKLKLQSLEEKHCNESCGCTTQIKTASLLLESIGRCLDGTQDESDLTQTVLILLESKQWGSVYSSQLFKSVACWLGKQFHRANSCISQKVESFKVQHIERITDLPPADQLATELFPEAMRTLMLHWMGLNDERNLEKRTSEYPILLLILEFANHNLITGAAHVLYSSLICR